MKVIKALTLSALMVFSVTSFTVHSQASQVPVIGATEAAIIAPLTALTYDSPTVSTTSAPIVEVPATEALTTKALSPVEQPATVSKEQPTAALEQPTAAPLPVVHAPTPAVESPTVTAPIVCMNGWILAEDLSCVNPVQPAPTEDEISDISWSVCPETGPCGPVASEPDTCGGPFIADAMVMNPCFTVEALNMLPAQPQTQTQAQCKLGYIGSGYVPLNGAVDYRDSIKYPGVVHSYGWLPKPRAIPTTDVVTPEELAELYRPCSETA